MSSKKTVGKLSLMDSLKERGYTGAEASDIVELMLGRIRDELMAGNSVTITGVCILTPNAKRAGKKKVAGVLKGVDATVSISSKTSKKFIAQYRAKLNPARPISGVRDAAKMFGK